MKNRNLIKKEYLTKIKELKEHNLRYYEKSSPKILDSEYDQLKQEIIDLEKKYKLYDLIIKFMVVNLTDDELERALGNNDEAEGEVEGEETEKVSKNDEK